jgi:hypothetical protein
MLLNMVDQLQRRLNGPNPYEDSIVLVKTPEDESS